MCSGHCAGLFQTIRDEGVDLEGRGALNFLGGLVQTVDDPANDEIEVHVGKQPDLTDLFLTADVVPHLRIGGVVGGGKLTQVNDRLSVNVLPATNAARVAISEANALTFPTGTTYSAIDLTWTQTLGKALSNLRGLSVTGTLQLAGFNVTSLFGLNFVPTVTNNVGGPTITSLVPVNASASLSTTGGATLAVTNHDLFRTSGSLGAGVTVGSYRGYHAQSPTGVGVATDRMGFDCQNQSFAAYTNAYGYRVREFLAGSPLARPFQEEGGPVADVHGNRFHSNTQLFSLTGAFGGGDGVLGVANARTVPNANPAGGGIGYAEAGELYWRSSAGVPGRVSDSQTDFTAGNGNNNDLAAGDGRIIRLTGPTAAFTITGIASGTAGQRIYLYNTVAQNMSITHEDANSAAANRIRTMDGLTHTTAGEGAAMLVYDGNAARWVLVHLEG